MRYLLDTHTLIWIITPKGDQLPQSLRDSLEYFEDSFSVSEQSLIEIVQLQQIGRLDANRPQKLRRTVEETGIEIVPVDTGILETFYDLPIPTINNKRHSDPFDRLIIATAIRRGMTLVSRDEKFPWYRDHCRLRLLQV